MATILTDVSLATHAPSNALTTRWDALDVLRGLTIILMLLNLGPGSWEFNFEQWVSPPAASLLFGICGILFLYAVLLVCHRRRWILKL